MSLEPPPFNLKTIFQRNYSRELFWNKKPVFLSELKTSNSKKDLPAREFFMKTYRQSVKLLMSNIGLQIFFYSVIFLSLSSFDALSAQLHKVEPDGEKVLSVKPLIYRLEPEARGGQAYKLVYLIGADVDVAWRFKTDFNKEFTLTNKFIKKHRLVSRKDKVVITEVEYSNRPDVKFKWRTTLSPCSYRIDFVLINPQNSKQKFHYGHVQLEPSGQNTKVIQVAYFDFFGAFLWAHYPWSGGMSDFLRYMVRWEQGSILRLKDYYGTETGQ